MDPGLRNKLVLITAAAKGIGGAIVGICAQEGAFPVARDEVARSSELERDFRGARFTGRLVPWSLTSPENCNLMPERTRELFQWLERHPVQYFSSTFARAQLKHTHGFILNQFEGCGDGVGQDVRMGGAQGHCTWPEVQVRGLTASHRHLSQHCCARRSDNFCLWWARYLRGSLSTMAKREPRFLGKNE